MFEGQIDRGGDREGLPKEILFESEQELLKRIHEIKKELKETEWSEETPAKGHSTIISQDGFGGG